MSGDWEDVATGPSVSSSGGEWEDVAYGSTSNPNNSEMRGIANDALRGVSSTLSLVDELNPIQTDPYKAALPGVKVFGVPLKVPHLWGLGGENTFDGQKAEPIGDVFNRVTTDYGIQTGDRPQTELGKFAGNAAENAASAVLFGPAAMAGSAVFGGTGGYLGEKVAPEIGFSSDSGRLFGSLFGGLSPAGLSKVGIVKEIGNQLGPTLSQLPVLRELFGNSSVNAAVGRTLGGMVEDLPTAEKAALAATQIDELDKFKTTAEVLKSDALARAEDATQAMTSTSPFKALAEQRAAAREASVIGNIDKAATPYDISKAMEDVVSTSASKVKEVENKVWSFLPRDAPVSTNIAGVEDSLKAAVNDITYSGALPLQGEAKALIKQFENATSEGTVSLGVIQDLRSKALQVARATGMGSSSEDRAAHAVANTLQEHLVNIVDGNVSAGNLSKEASDLWEAGRAATRSKVNTFGAPKVGTGNTGTKALEQLGLREQALDNTTLLREGLSSPDKMAAHIAAAKAGGEDIVPLYQQALKAELDNVPQNKWASTVANKRKQWEKVFTAEDMANIDRNIADVESAAQKVRGYSVGGSATNPRGNIQDTLNSGKGIANLINASKGAPALAGAYLGAQKGWNDSETTAGGIGNALLYGSIGAMLGKGATNLAKTTSGKYNTILTEALTSPAKFAEVIEAAKPSRVGKAATALAVQGGKGVAARAVNQGANSLMNSLFGGDGNSKKSTVTEDLFSNGTNMSEAPKVKETPPEVKKVFSSLIKQESAGNKNAVSTENEYMKAKGTGTAKGVGQLLDATGKEMFTKYKKELGKDASPEKYDPFNEKQNALLSEKYLTELYNKYDDIELALTAYHSGMGTVDKLLRANNATTLAGIIDDLGPVGQKYAKQVLGRIKV